MTVFQTMVADCPWQPRDALPGPKRGAKKHYRTMSTRDMCALRLPQVAPNGLLFLWRLSSMPFDALDVCKAWGFEPVSEIVWIKTPKASLDELHTMIATKVGRATLAGPDAISLAAAMGLELARKVRLLLGHYVRLSHETCIIAARHGAASTILRHDIPSVLFAPLGRHSEKPAAFFDLVEKLAPGPYVELFARTPRNERWTCLGDELGTTLDLPLAPSRSA